jgi:hypothetical protein
MDTSKIVCPHCGSKNCFHEDAGNDVTTYLCMSCGYTSNDLFKTDSEQIEGYEISLPDLYKDIKFLDTERGITWYPSVMNVPNYGIVFIDGTDKSNWKWKAAPAVDVAESEREKYPIPGKPGEFYTKRLDMTLAKEFAQTQFTDACKHIGIIKS